MKIAIIGAGLAGCECAWILANQYGLKVALFEMKTLQMTPAQRSPHLFSELVCSNSLKSKSLLNPAGLLKKEIEKLGSLIIPSALNAEVPAGETLAVDRELFSEMITKKIKSHKNIEIHSLIIQKLEDLLSFGDFSAIVIATGPLTDHALATNLQTLTQSDSLYFYDAIAPIIDGETIDHNVASLANRMTKTQIYENKKVVELSGLPPIYDNNLEGDYLNLPLEKEEYFQFVQKLLEAPKLPHKEFEEPRYFNGCQPIEVLAERGLQTLSFGPMKPKGLIDPKTGKMPYAVVQLRKENLGETAWNMVGFQTRLTWGAQNEIFKTLPGLKHAEFFRMGSMHRNTYLLSPTLLNEDLSLKINNKVYLAGQIMGVEGYLESAAMGVLIAHMIGFKLTKFSQLQIPPANTALGCLARYCLYEDPKRFTPMNIHWGLYGALSEEDFNKYSNNLDSKIKINKINKTQKRELLSNRSQDLFSQWMNDSKLNNLY